MAQTIDEEQIAVFRQAADEVVAALGSDSQRGLSAPEARARLAHYGPNELEAEPPTPAWRRFLAQFQDVLVILLLIATAISIVLWVYERDTALPYEGLVIFAIVLLNGILGYVQETRAERAVAALRAMAAAEASVMRDGQRQKVAATELVPGDIILIEEGDTIPADARLLHSTALQTAEAALTGESLPVSKDTLPIAEDVGVGDRHNMLFSGTYGEANAANSGQAAEWYFSSYCFCFCALRAQKQNTWSARAYAGHALCASDDCVSPVIFQARCTILYHKGVSAQSWLLARMMSWTSRSPTE